MLIFCGWSQPQNCFNSEIFPIYSMLHDLIFIGILIYTGNAGRKRSLEAKSHQTKPKKTKDDTPKVYQY